MSDLDEAHHKTADYINMCILVLDAPPLAKLQACAANTTTMRMEGYPAYNFDATRMSVLQSDFERLSDETKNVIRGVASNLVNIAAGISNDAISSSNN
jgi:hypothetical protein